ncbi:ATP-binding protein [Streptacidiphilus sp. N1-10]|uniref:ATP-binding protein n=1 Tax=Streptacidiphilus jeojiensis TaxID=3229225 RepID=A0ABV6XYF6_9ACTN
MGQDTVRRTPVLPPGGQIRRLALTGTAGPVGRARDFSRKALTDWEWLPGRTEEQQAVAEDVLLLVSELVTNACLHAGGPTELALRCTGERLRVEVSDLSPQQPHPRTPHQAARPGGHGLHIVTRLAEVWGSAPSERGKTVWLEVRAAR